MKKLIFSAAILAACITSVAQPLNERVLLTVNGDPSTVGEFLYIYNKNQQETTITEQSLDEYLEMFINFKLKVADAKAQGIDTLKSFKDELKNYRHQATPRYMTDSAAEQRIIERTYENMKTDKLVRHIVIRCAMNENDSATAVARGKIEVARERVTTGIPVTVGKGKKKKTVCTPEDFAKVALEVSDDPSVQQNEGLIGWITPFHFVYPFEKATYETALGEVSEIFRTPFGFHFLRVEDEAPHKEVNAAHIMKRVVPSNINNPEEAKRENEKVDLIAKSQIDSIYQIAKEGKENFGNLAMNVSDDRGTAQRAGNLGWFTRGQMVKEFEKTAFSMSTPGDISEPFRTDYGWHIMQFYGERGTAPYDELKETIRKNIKHDQRREEIEQSFADKIKKEYGFNEDPSALQAFIDAAAKCPNLADSAFLARIDGMHAFMFSVADNTYTQDDFREYIKTNTWSQYGTMKDALNEKYNAFKNQKLREMEDRHLEEKYPELRNLMKEYHDGILLFDISLEKVWDKAGQDTVGLQQYFAAHKKDYMWDTPHFKGWIIRAKTQQALKAAKNIVKNIPADKVDEMIAQRVNADSTVFVRCERGLWTKGENPVVDKYAFKDKKAEIPNDTVFVCTDVVGKKLKGAEEYQDERGKVVSAYQDYLEQTWLKELHEKYPVVVDEKVLNQLKESIK